MEYCEILEKDTIVTNVIRGECWKAKKTFFGERYVLPMFLYQDDFETNNALGSHKGFGKVSAVYIVLPCLCPIYNQKQKIYFYCS